MYDCACLLDKCIPCEICDDDCIKVCSCKKCSCDDINKCELCVSKDYNFKVSIFNKLKYDGIYNLSSIDDIKDIINIKTDDYYYTFTLVKTENDTIVLVDDVVRFVSTSFVLSGGNLFYVPK